MLDDDRDECDFCELPLDEDEELTPVHVGGHATVKPIYVKAIGKLRKSHPRPSEEGRILLEELRQHDKIGLDVEHGVEVIRSKSGALGATVKSSGASNFESHTDMDKTAVMMSIQPDVNEPDPDAELCPNCAEQFRSFGE